MMTATHVHDRPLVVSKSLLRRREAILKTHPIFDTQELAANLTATNHAA